MMLKIIVSIPRIIRAALLWNRGLSLLEKGEFVESLKYLEMSESKYILAVEERAVKAYVLFRLKRYEEALNYLRKCINETMEHKRLGSDDKRYLLYYLECLEQDILCGKNVDYRPQAQKTGKDFDMELVSPWMKRRYPIRALIQER